MKLGFSLSEPRGGVTQLDRGKNSGHIITVVLFTGFIPDRIRY